MKDEATSEAIVRRLEAVRHVIRLVPSEGGGGTAVVRDTTTGSLAGGADPRGRSCAMGR